MTRDILIEGGTIVNADGRRRADLLCRDGKIAAIGEGLEASSGTERVDAGGCFVLPGGIDPHTHLQLPMMGTVVADDFFTGSAAGAAGGTTTFLDFVGPDKGQSPLAALAQWREKASKASIDYGFHMTVSWWSDEFSAEMGTLVRDHGVTSFKFFLAYKGGLMLPDEEILAGFLRCRDLGALPQVHAENGELIAYLQKKLKAEGILGPKGHPLSRPSLCEGEATQRAIAMTEVLGMPLYVVHVSAAEAADAIARAQARGARVIGETLPGFLAIDDSVYDDPDFDIAAGHVMSPPYRPAGHPDALWKAVEAGTLSITGTDHCCFTKQQKRLGLHDFTKIPNGCGGIEDRMNILWALGVDGGHLSPERFVGLTSANAAKIFNLWPRKGVLAPGADADIAILDPAGAKTIRAAAQHQNTDFSVWENRELKGSIVHTIAGGRHIWADGDLRAEPGAGRFLPRAPFGPAYEGLGRCPGGL